MEAVILAIFVFATVVVIGTVFFGGWLIVTGFRLIGRTAGLIAGPSSRDGTAVGQPPPHLVRCGHSNCRADNMKVARFCRRCGKPFQVQAVQSNGRRGKRVVGRAAMW